MRPDRPVIYPALKAKRDALRAAKRCVCGPVEGDRGSGGVVHGPPVKAGKCQRCVDVHEAKRADAKPLRVDCPVCPAYAGLRCRGEDGSFVSLHPERRAAAERAA